ncbi:MAG: RNA polymerase sigma factor [Patescibacteria group bacterium]|nr:RNA polymerase sigma factor [Patescibacteria group bacterium]
MEKIKEKILLTKVRAGDKEAFGQLYDLYVERIYRFIYFKVSRASDAEDLSSEVFLRSWKYISDGAEVKNFKAFLYRISRNVIIDFYRKNYGKYTLNIEDEAIVDNLRANNLIEKIDINIQIKEVMKALDKLKEEYRESILLRFVEDYSISEIAEIMNRSNGAVRVLLHRAIESLKKKLRV